MARSVYIVTAGDYSDYRIQAVFSSRKLAEEYVAIHNKKESYNHAEVEEWELISTTPISGKQLHLQARISATKVEDTHRFSYDIITGPSPSRRVDTTIQMYGKDKIWLVCSGNVPMRVEKVFTEKKRQIRAEFGVFLERLKKGEVLT